MRFQLEHRYAMSNPRRRHFSRIVLWQECVGNVLDLPPRYCLASSGPDVQETTFDTAAGTEVTTGREHVIEVPLSDEETARLAEIMEELSTLYGHRVGATLLGSRGAQHRGKAHRPQERHLKSTG